MCKHGLLLYGGKGLKEGLCDLVLLLMSAPSLQLAQE
jgi:hypothetical protein